MERISLWTGPLKLWCQQVYNKLHMQQDRRNSFSKQIDVCSTGKGFFFLNCLQPFLPVGSLIQYCGFILVLILGKKKNPVQSWCANLCQRLSIRLRPGLSKTIYAKARIHREERFVFSNPEKRHISWHICSSIDISLTALEAEGSCVTIEQWDCRSCCCQLLQECSSWNMTGLLRNTDYNTIRLPDHMLCSIWAPKGQKDIEITTNK